MWHGSPHLFSIRYLTDPEVNSRKALLGFGPRISRLLDRHFNQLSHSALQGVVALSSCAMDVLENWIPFYSWSMSSVCLWEKCSLSQCVSHDEQVHMRVLIFSLLIFWIAKRLLRENSRVSKGWIIPVPWSCCERPSLRRQIIGLFDWMDCGGLQMLIVLSVLSGL